MFLIPIPICAIGYIVYKKKYNLYGARYDEIKAEIERRRAEAGAVPAGEGEALKAGVVEDVTDAAMAKDVEVAADTDVVNVESVEDTAGVENDGKKD